LLSKQSGGNIQALKPKIEWQNVRQANTALLESGVTLIAVNDRLDVATMLDLPLQETDMLYVVCHDDVFERLS